jgi:hemoglobin/transferrin/lactoferrin receptor protein
LIETSNGTLSFAEWHYGPQLWRMHALQAVLSGPNKLYNSARIIAAFQDYRESRHDRRLNNARIRNQVEKVHAFSINADFDKQLSKKSELFYGLEYVTNDVGSFADRINLNNGTVEPVATRYPNNSEWNSYGAYISYKLNHNQLSFTSGLRYNHATVYTPFDTSLFNFPFTEANIKKGAVTGNLGMVFRPNKNSKWNFNIATGFRVPNVDDVGKVFESAPGQLMTPNPDLKSEYAYNFDLGYAVRIANRVVIDLTAFYTLLDNAIARRPATFNGQDSVDYEGVRSRVFSLQNAAKAEVVGVQAGVELFFAKYFSGSVQVNWIEGEETDDVKDEDVPLRHAPPFYGNAHLKYNRSKLQADLYLLWNGQISNEELAPSEQAKTFIYAKDANGKPYCPSWYTLNLKLGYQVNKHLYVTAGCENITNQLYRPYSSGIVAPGTNFITSLRASL